MITAVVGLPGSGKSLHASKEIKKAIDKKEIVFSNIHVNDNRDYFYYDDFTLLTKCKNGLIILDEAQVYMNSRNWQNFPPEFQFFLQRHRHNGLNLLALTQNLNRTDKVFRELVQELWEVRINFVLFGYGFYSLQQIKEVETDYVRSDTFKRYLLTKKDFEYYNTFAFETPKNTEMLLTTCEICGRNHKLIGWS